MEMLIDDMRAPGRRGSMPKSPSAGHAGRHTHVVPRENSVGGFEDTMGGVVYGRTEFFVYFGEAGELSRLSCTYLLPVFGVWTFDELALQRGQGTQVRLPTISRIWVHLNT